MFYPRAFLSTLDVLVSSGLSPEDKTRPKLEPTGVRVCPEHTNPSLVGVTDFQRLLLAICQSARWKQES